VLPGIDSIPDGSDGEKSSKDDTRIVHRCRGDGDRCGCAVSATPCDRPAHQLTHAEESDGEGDPDDRDAILFA
jgi:hypothetical protein